MDIKLLACRIVDEIINECDIEDGYNKSEFVDEYTDQISTNDADCLICHLETINRYDLVNEVKDALKELHN